MITKRNATPLALKPLTLTLLALNLASGLAFAQTPPQANPPTNPPLSPTTGAQILYTNDKLLVIDARGAERPARQGDVIQPGERLIAPPGIVGQVRMPDGTLVGLRPDSEIRFQPNPAGDKNVIELTQGKVRVINSVLPGSAQPKPAEIVTENARFQIGAGDGETLHLKPDSKPGPTEPGSYSRLQAGTGTLLSRTGTGSLPLRPLENAFVLRPEAMPLALAQPPLQLTSLGTLAVPLRTSSTTTPTLSSTNPALAVPITGLNLSTAPLSSGGTLSSGSLLSGGTLSTGGLVAGTGSTGGTVGSTTGGATLAGAAGSGGFKALTGGGSGTLFISKTTSLPASIISSSAPKTRKP